MSKGNIPVEFDKDLYGGDGQYVSELPVDGSYDDDEEQPQGGVNRQGIGGWFGPLWSPHAGFLLRLWNLVLHSLE